MTAKNRNKNNSQHDKSPSIPHDEALKNQKNAPVAAGPSALMKFISAVFYVTLAGGAGIAALYFHQELCEMKLVNLKHEELIHRYTDVTRDVQRALQQVSSVKESLEGLESAVGSVKADLESSSRAVQRGEAENRRLEETVQNLQNKITRDLPNSLQEVKEARERDVVSLEQILEERLAQLSRSMAEFSGEQSRYEDELKELKSHLETPALLKQQLTSISLAVANLNTASEVSEGNVEVLREQISAVSAELQTRNTEVASVSEEIQSLRSLLGSVTGAIREEVTAARTDAQASLDRVQTLSHALESSHQSLQSLETQLREEVLRAGDLQVRLKATEESHDSLMSSLMEQNHKLDALTLKHESQESLLQIYQTTAVTLRDDVEEMKTTLKHEASEAEQHVEMTADDPSETE